MNIISNECTGGYIYNALNEQYNNPFIWTNVLDDDFLYLMKNYENINFQNYQIKLLTNSEHIWTFPNDTLLPALYIDNHLTIYYTHHLYSKNYDNMSLIPNLGVRRYAYVNMEQFVKDRYERQVKRMLKKQDETIFIFHDWNHFKDINLMLNSNKHTIILTGQLKTHNISNTQIINYNDISVGATNVDPEPISRYLLQNKLIHNI